MGATDWSRMVMMTLFCFVIEVVYFLLLDCLSDCCCVFSMLRYRYCCLLDFPVCQLLFSCLLCCFFVCHDLTWDWLISRLIDWLIDRLMDRSVVGWLAVWLHVVSLVSFIWFGDLSAVTPGDFGSMSAVTLASFCWPFRGFVKLISVMVSFRSSFLFRLSTETAPRWLKIAPSKSMGDTHRKNLVHETV